MITIQYSTSIGVMIRLDVVEFEFVQKCRHCRQEFLTIDPDKVYCKPSHRVRASELRVS